MINKITTDTERKIIAEFAKEVKERAEPGPSPEFTVIDFRNERLRGKAGERKVYFIPTDILRFRKDNGRNAADVMSYERLNGPCFAHLPEKEFAKKVEEIKENFLYPLEAVDRYLESLGREQLYNTIAGGSHNKDGRWYSFIDYYKHVYKKLDDEKSRIKIGIEEDEVGEIEDICFKIIRKKDFKGLMKTHMVMRKIPSIK